MRFLIQTASFILAAIFGATKYKLSTVIYSKLNSDKITAILCATNNTAIFIAAISKLTASTCLFLPLILPAISLRYI